MVSNGAAALAADISVIICAHNPRPDYLSRVLQALTVQTLPKEHWELLLVDNASQVALADTVDLSWHPRARHILEEELGLTAARLRGIRESRAGIVVYVDDDNVLAPDYLEMAAVLLREHPYLGAIGAGNIEPEFEVQPSRELVPHLRYLSLRCVEEARWSNSTHDKASMPWGAGLAVTREVAHAYMGLLQQLSINELLDRRGTQLFGNGDVAFSWSATLLGLGFGVFPTLRVTHLIRADRISPSYLLRVVRDSTFSNGVSDYLWTGELPGDDHPRSERYVRLGLLGIRKGSFAMRIASAKQCGTDQARALIRGQGLRRVVHGKS
jgi:glycosyltransferase involved in cell wall biosynthesis